jgi:hypothetical protein
MDEFEERRCSTHDQFTLDYIFENMKLKIIKNIIGIFYQISFKNCTNLTRDIWEVLNICY